MKNVTKKISLILAETELVIHLHLKNILHYYYLWTYISEEASSGVVTFDKESDKESGAPEPLGKLHEKLVI